MLRAVRSSNLKPAQVQQLEACVGRQLAYLNRLLERMDRLGWEPSDPMYVAALQARNGVHALHVAALYAGIGHGVGKEVGVTADPSPTSPSRQAPASAPPL